MNQPIQPLEKRTDGILRFTPNAVVRYLLDNGPIDMNHLANCPFGNNDREQFAQLIGYSLSGFEELSYVSDETYEAAERMADGTDERDATIAALRAKLAAVRGGIRKGVAVLFGVHPDDLKGGADPDA